jgi:hypothetical protein
VQAGPFRVRDEHGGVLAGHEAEYGDDTAAEVVGGSARRRARLGLAPTGATSGAGAPDASGPAGPVEEDVPANR